jgi:hypothetical protein
MDDGRIEQTAAERFAREALRAVRLRQAEMSRLFGRTDAALAARYGDLEGLLTLMEAQDRPCRSPRLLRALKRLLRRA